MRRCERSAKLAFCCREGVDVRFFRAIVVLVVSLLFFLTSLVIRNFFSAPDTLTQTISVTGDAPVTVISAKELRAVSNRETIYVSSTAGDSKPTNASSVTIAWGRMEDVKAWIGNAPYQSLTIAKKTGVITETSFAGLEPTVPDPRGSDLWVEEWSGSGETNATLSLRKGNTVVIIGDGKKPAPKEITIIWDTAVDHTIPTILLYLAAASGIVGLVLLAIALWRERRQRRHRQGRMPKSPKPPRWRPKRGNIVGGSFIKRKGRRFAGFIAGSVVIPALLAGCSTESTPQQTPTPVATGQLPFVAVTNPQFDRILTSIVNTLTEADTKRAENLAAERVTGAALRFRASTYRVMAANSKLGSLFTIPNGTVSLLLPQQTDSWPRSVFAIIDDNTNTESPSVALVMTQDGPRSNYTISYTFSLEPGVVMPEVPSADYGTAVLPGDTELLSSTPEQVAKQYGDLLLNGDASAYASIFESDTLQDQIGAAAKKKRADSMSGKAKFSWVETMTDDEPVVFATSDAGALVALTINEGETVRPAKAGSAISTEGAVRILSSRASTLRGITANYQYQLLLHVPAIGSSDKIRLLGYSYALVSAQEVR